MPELSGRLAALLDKADLAVAACEGVVEPSDLDPIAGIIRDARIRTSYPHDLIVAALAGGTGSGKSSLFNAIAGPDLVEVGGVRPTTSEAVAAAGESRLPEISGYLDSIGVENRLIGDLPDWLCLMDLPDTDSVEVDHRHLVEALLPRVDVVVWVMDPEKYRDAAIHHDHLTGLSPYDSQLLFVLNQADRLDEKAVPAVMADLSDALAEDGLENAVVLATSAHPPAGPPRGLDELLKAIQTMAGGAIAKLVIDLEQAASLLVAATGRPTMFDERAARVGSADEAIDLLTAIADETDGPVAKRIREIAVTAPGRPGAAGVLAEARHVLRVRAEANARLADLRLALGELRRTAG